MLVTALLESIDLLLQFSMDIITNAGQAHKYVQVKPTLTQTKSDPNDPYNPDDLTQLQH